MNYDSIEMIYPLSSFFVRNIISKTNESDLFSVVVKSVIVDLAEGQFRTQIMIFAEVFPGTGITFSHLENELVSGLKKKNRCLVARKTAACCNLSTNLDAPIL